MHVIFGDSNANNHVLFNLLAKLSIEGFGVSAWALRLPTLGGAAMFVFASVGISRMAYSGVISRAVAFCALTLNPFVLDFLVAARGYGLALGCLAVGVHTGAALVSSNTRNHLDYSLVAVCLGLAVSANLTFAFPAIGVAMTVCAICTLTSAESPSAEARRLLIWFVLPGALIPSTLLIRPLLNAQREDFYYGGGTLGETIRSLVDASLRHHPTSWTDSPIAARATALFASVAVPALATLFAVTLVVSVLQVMGLRRNTNERTRTVAFATGAFWMSLLTITGAHYAAGVPYPLNRTGLYLIFLFTVTLLALCSGLQRRQARCRPCPRYIQVVLGVIALHYAAQANVTHFREWRFDAGAKEIFERAAQYRSPDGRLIRLVASDAYEPSLNFYRQLSHADDIGPILTWQPGDVGFDLLVTNRDLLAAALMVASPIYIHPISGAVLLRSKMSNVRPEFTSAIPASGNAQARRSNGVAPAGPLSPSKECRTLE